MARTLLNTSTTRGGSGKLYLTSSNKSTDPNNSDKTIIYTGYGDWNVDLRSQLADAREITKITYTFYLTAKEATTGSVQAGFYSNTPGIVASTTSSQTIGNSYKTIKSFTSSIVFDNGSGLGHTTKTKGLTLLNYLKSNKWDVEIYARNPSTLTVYYYYNATHVPKITVYYYNTANEPKVTYVNASSPYTATVGDTTTLSVPVNYSLGGINIDAGNPQTLKLYYTTDNTNPTTSSQSKTVSYTALSSSTKSGTATFSLDGIDNNANVRMMVEYVYGKEKVTTSVVKYEPVPPIVPLHLDEHGGVGVGSYTQRSTDAEPTFECHYPAYFSEMLNFRAGKISSTGVAANTGNVAKNVVFDKPFPDTIDEYSINIFLTIKNYSDSVDYGNITYAAGPATKTGFTAYLSRYGGTYGRSPELAYLAVAFKKVL